MTAAVQHIILDASADGQRLDRWLKKTYPALSFGQLQKLIRTGQIRIDGKRAKGDSVLQEGQDMRLPPALTGAPPKMSNSRSLEPTDKERAQIRGMVIYEDDNLIALNKPHGLAVQGGTKTTHHIDRLLPALAGRNGFIPKLVHRIDKDTSGLLLLAKSNEYAKILAEKFKSRDIRKTYIALCAPTPTIHDGTIKAALVKTSQGHGHDREQVVVDEEFGKSAVTDYRVIDHAGRSAALVAFFPRTGRTHQIRVHSQVMGSPILGDPKYGLDHRRVHSAEVGEYLENSAEGLLDLCDYRGLHLHAYAVHLSLPGYRGGLSLKAPLSREIQSSMRRLGFSGLDLDLIDPFTNP